MRVQFLGQEDPLENPGVGNGNPLQYSCLENSTEEPGGLSPRGSKELDAI